VLWREDITDPQLFNAQKFSNSLKTSGSALNLYKQALQSGSAYLTDQFESGGPVKEILYRRAWLIDQLLISVWHETMTAENISLVAVGGYGRGADDIFENRRSSADGRHDLRPDPRFL